ncbi:uncharacterized protein BO66DRAFT_69046 [Aspergillus aculeatinus CBS 121060]|uniref:Uncharacterized protein n=1 Tax=Aspergillus aculeatinus CBS 121060 TaxID=1448322 RepID=A0ACD1HMQ0_9EURO|nr:hypothetical protein BO66DRAFT_69046 [Aspergillus aculeatinus CBS 121060]RAH74885.1 hypothetical protein BO66DRAFT_69046 [Aspergillus aculeatinus CBS 121060]
MLRCLPTIGQGSSIWQGARSHVITFPNKFPSYGRFLACPIICFRNSFSLGSKINAMSLMGRSTFKNGPLSDEPPSSSFRKNLISDTSSGWRICLSGVRKRRLAVSTIPNAPDISVRHAMCWRTVNSAGENDSTFQACSNASILVHSVRHGSRLLNRPRHES